MPEKVPLSAVRFYEDRLVTQFRTADDQLGSTPYLTGNDLTVADLGLYPIYAGRRAEKRRHLGRSGGKSARRAERE
jgi:glutathione S-transferase